MIAARIDRRPWLLAAVCLAAAAVGLFETAGGRAEDKPPVREASGIELGGDAMVVYVVRDKAAWDALRKEGGSSHFGIKRPPALVVLDGVDFQKDMIVAVFWGRMNFSGRDENCRISDVKIGEKEISVECVANLWGGQILRSYQAWPYAAKVIAKSDLPVTFIQTVEYKAKPDRARRGERIATLKPPEWKQEIKDKPENAL